MGKRDNGKPVPGPSRLPLAALAVELKGEARLRMENLLLERDLLDEQRKNLELRRADLDREASVLNAGIETNRRIRDEFIAARGFDVSKPIAYGDGTLSEA